MVGNRSFWPWVTTALAKHTAGQVACRTSCKAEDSDAALTIQEGHETPVSSGSRL